MMEFDVDIRQVLQEMYDVLPQDDEDSPDIVRILTESVRKMLRDYPVERPHQTAAIAISFMVPMLDSSIEEHVRYGLMMVAAKLWGEA